MLRRIVDRARVLIRAEAQIDPWFPRMRTRSAESPPHGGGAVRLGAGRTGPHSGMPAAKPGTLARTATQNPTAIAKKTCSADLNLHTTPGGACSSDR
jgi:hypothetical protein